MAKYCTDCSSTAALLYILSSSETSDDQWGAIMIMTNEESESEADKDWNSLKCR